MSIYTSNKPQSIQWRAIGDENILPEFFIAWNPRFPDMCACFRRSIFMSMRRRDTPDHLNARGYTHWCPINPPGEDDDACKSDG